MHTHSRTLIAKLGFADPDKKEPLHDLACQYVAQREVAIAIGEQLLEEPWQFKGSEIEVPLKPQTATGFMDVVLEYYNEPHNGWSGRMVTTDSGKSHWELAPSCCDRPGCAAPTEGHYRPKNHTQTEFCMVPIHVEVKIQPISVGDIIRQIKFYRTYRERGHWVLVAGFDITPDIEPVLRDAGIIPIRLGAGFADFVKKQRTLRATDSTTVGIV